MELAAARHKRPRGVGQVLLANARRAIEDAWAIVGGTDEDEDDDADDDDDLGDQPTWSGEESANRAIRLIGEGLIALLASLEGAPEALASGAGAGGVRLAAQLTAAHQAGRLVIDSDESPTVLSLADAVMTLTSGFSDLVGALGESATITELPSGAVGAMRLLPQTLGETTISDESRDGLKGRRHMATKDKGGSKSSKKTPAKTLKQKRQTKKAKQAGGTAK